MHITHQTVRASGLKLELTPVMCPDGANRFYADLTEVPQCVSAMLAALQMALEAQGELLLGQRECPSSVMAAFEAAELVALARIAGWRCGFGWKTHPHLCGE